MASHFAEELVALLPRLRRFALSLTGRADQADDLVQSACERALRAQDRWEPGTRLDSWMFCIIRNLWIDTIRRRKRAGPTEDIDAALDLAGADGRETTENALTLTAIGAALTRMPEDLRVVLVHVCIEDKSYRDTATALGIPIGTVMSRLARARRVLAGEIGLVPSEKGSAKP